MHYTSILSADSRSRSSSSGATRKVVGQILDYAKELASWGYSDLQREVSRTLKRKGNVLYELIREHAPEVNEAEFVDNVTRHLRRGEFLLLIVGDGIREDVENIVDFVQRHSGLHFNLASRGRALSRWRRSARATPGPGTHRCGACR